jgi:uncharacterized membrane protein YphA (DoxX/SURF4 family)
MSLVRTLARPMLASMFVYGGLDALRHPETKAARAGDVAEAVAEALPVPLPDDRVQLVRINGAVQLGAGLLLATGRFPRLAALALAASLAPTTAAGHRFWEADDEQTRSQQRIHFLKNTSMFGGLLLAALDTEGRPSVAWWARRAARRTGDRLHESASRTAGALHDALPVGAH